MVNRPKIRGTAAETAVVHYLKARGWYHAERRALTGNKDRGDVAGIAGCVIEVKDCKTLTFGPWLNEAETEKANDNAAVGVVWAKRRGTTDPGKWFVLMTGEQFTSLLKDAGY